MYNNLNNIQRRLEDKSEASNVPFLSYEERQALKQEQYILSNIKQIALYCTRVSCDSCKIRNVIECDGHMTEKNVNGSKKLFKNGLNCSKPCDWMYYIDNKSKQRG